MQVGIYLTFEGNCAEAFEFYKSVFGGEFTWKGTYENAPDSVKAEMDVTDLDKILHVSLPIGGDDEEGKNKINLMGCDYVPSMKSNKNFGASNVEISLTPKNCQEADRLFKALVADGGIVDMPMQDMFWGSYHGFFQDRFGIKWMIDCASEKAKDEELATKETKLASTAVVVDEK